jgi:hypothetical protein
MRPFLIACLMLAAPAFSQQMIAKQGDNAVRIMDKPCVVASVLMHIPEPHRKAFRKADAKIEGQRYFACWRLVEDKVHLVYEDGDQGLISVSEFKEEPGA